MTRMKQLALLAVFASSTLLGAFGINLTAGCASVKPALASVDEIAQTLCAKYHQETLGLDLEDLDRAAELYCKTREAYAPWIDAALASVQTGGVAKASAAKACEPAPTVPVNPQPPADRSSTSTQSSGEPATTVPPGGG